MGARKHSLLTTSTKHQRPRKRHHQVHLDLTDQRVRNLSPTYFVRLWLVVLLCVGSWLVLPTRLAAQGTWSSLVHTAPEGVNTMLLLSDGTVMAAGSSMNSWYRLTPDSSGSYVNGTWSTLASMNDSRLYFSSDVLTNGQVFVAGAEYGTGTNSAEIYDPPSNTWTRCPPPPAGQTRFLDSVSKILPNGNVLIAPVGPATSGGTVIYVPASNTWINGPTLFRGFYQDEASWVKLADDSILTIDPFGTHSERYLPSLNRWIDDATVPVALYDSFGFELGAAFLLPDGRAFFLGATGNTALYTPSGNTNMGVWQAGPVMPNGQGTPDAPAAMMVNGKILCAVSPVPTSANHFPDPTSFYEYDSVANSFAQVSGPTGLTYPGGTYVMRMLDLPDGSVLLATSGSQLYAYQPAGLPLLAGKPAVSNVTQNADQSFHITGTLFNGISEGAAYGDDVQMDSNYPLVRMSDLNGIVYYARTYGWISTSVMTSNRPVSTEFMLPANLPATNLSLVVVANGNSSAPVSFSTATLSPVIVAQPRSQTAVAGASVTFTIAAAGTPLHYAWQRNGVPIAGATASSYTTNNVQFANSGDSFSCVASNFNGATPSSNALLIVVSGPSNDLCSAAFVITANNYTNAQSTSLAASTGDPSPSCVGTFGKGVWYVYTAPSNGIVIADTIGSSFDTAMGVYSGSCGALTLLACDDDSGGSLTSRITNTVVSGVSYYYLVGGYNGTAGNLVFHLNFTSASGPPSITSQPASQSALIGGNATFSVGAIGSSPLAYFWKRNGSFISGGTASSYTTNNVQLADSGTQFSCLVSNSLGTVLSANATLTVGSSFPQNGGFELGSFASWTTSGNFVSCSVVNSPAFVHSGIYSAQLGPFGNLGFLSQSVPTSPAQVYLISCWVYSDGQIPNEFSVSWDGVGLFDQTDNDTAG